MHYSQISSKSRAWLPRLLLRSDTFTPQEVCRRLRDERADDQRTAAVHAAAAQTGLWSARLPDRAAFKLGRTASRLPSVVFWYRQGISLEDIGRRLSGFGGAWDAEQALDAAAALIAEALNRGARVDLAA